LSSEVAQFLRPRNRSSSLRKRGVHRTPIFVPTKRKKTEFLKGRDFSFYTGEKGETATCPRSRSKNTNTPPSIITKRSDAFYRGKKKYRVLRTQGVLRDKQSACRIQREGGRGCNHLSKRVSSQNGCRARMKKGKKKICPR